MRQEAVVRREHQPLARAFKATLEPEHPTDPGHRQRLAQARARVYVVHQGRQDPKSRSLAALVGVLLLAACSGGGQKAAPTTTSSTDSSSSSSETRPTAPRSADDADWVGQGLQPISQLVGAGGRIVYLGVDDNEQLQLIGLNPSTGRVVWHRPSTMANSVPGVQEQLVVRGDVVYHVEPVGAGNSRVALPAQANRAADVVAIDARTGNETWRVAFGPGISTPLEACGDGLCVYSLAAAGHLDITRLHFVDGHKLSQGHAAFEPVLATDGESAVSAARDSNGVALTSGFGTTTVWTHTRMEVFGTADVTPDAGWTGVHIDGVWVISLGADGPSLGATSGVTDEGTTLWTRPDTQACFVLTDDPSTEPVLCGQVDRATQRFTMGVVERVDPTTGAGLWSVDASAIDILHPASSLVRMDTTVYALELPAGDITLDLVSGAGAAPTQTSGWCETFGDFVTVEGQDAIVAMSWAPCTLGVGPNHAPPTSVPEFAGPTVDGFGAWVEDGEVRAAKVA